MKNNVRMVILNQTAHILNWIIKAFLKQGMWLIYSRGYALYKVQTLLNNHSQLVLL